MTDMNTLTPTPEACAQTIQSLVDYCATRHLIGWADRVWAYNTVLDCMTVPGPAPATEWVLADKPHTSVLNPSPADDYELKAALALISEVAVAHGAAEDTASGRDRIAMRVMGALMPRPSEVATEFRGRLDVGERHAATDWYYRMCCDCGYVRHAAIARNIAWEAPTQWGRLGDHDQPVQAGEGPARDRRRRCRQEHRRGVPRLPAVHRERGLPRTLRRERQRPPRASEPAHRPHRAGRRALGVSIQPLCVLQRALHRHEHEPRPMHIDRAAVTCLLDFVDALPHYFIGSNADLPVVGGSILSHDHFQGGAHEFPMMKAPVVGTFSIDGYPDVEGAVLRWPLSVLRLRQQRPHPAHRCHRTRHQRLAVLDR